MFLNAKEVKAIRAFIAMVPELYCHNLHHRKGEYHGAGQPCPALARFNAAQQAASDAVMEKKKNVPER